MSLISPILTWLSSILDAIWNIPTYLSDLLDILLHALIYPFTRISELVGEIIGVIYDTLYGLYSSIDRLGDVVYNFLSSVVDILPGPWATIMLLMITLIIVLRLYYFIKSIKIAGFGL